MEDSVSPTDLDYPSTNEAGGAAGLVPTGCRNCPINHKRRSTALSVVRGAPQLDLVDEDPVFTRTQVDPLIRFELEFPQAIVVDLDPHGVAPLARQLDLHPRPGGVDMAYRRWKRSLSIRYELNIEQMRSDVDHRLIAVCAVARFTVMYCDRHAPYVDAAVLDSPVKQLDVPQKARNKRRH